MPIGILFWVLMFVWLIFGFVGKTMTPEYYGYGHTLLVFVLLGLLGWKTYGPALQG